MAHPGEGAEVANLREMKAARIYGLLTRYVGEKVLSLTPDQVAGETNAMFARRCYETLAGHFDVGLRQRSRLARTQLMKFEMMGKETMEGYLNRFILTVSQATDAAILLSEAEKIEILLNGLRESAEYKDIAAMLLSQANLNNVITSTQICNELRCYASCQPCQKEDGKAFYIKGEKRKQDKQPKQSSSQQERRTLKWPCSICKKKDHRTHECPQMERIHEFLKSDAKAQFQAAAVTEVNEKQKRPKVPEEPIAIEQTESSDDESVELFMCTDQPESKGEVTEQEVTTPEADVDILNPEANIENQEAVIPEQEAVMKEQEAEDSNPEIDVSDTDMATGNPEPNPEINFLQTDTDIGLRMKEEDKEATTLLSNSNPLPQFSFIIDSGSNRHITNEIDSFDEGTLKQKRGFVQSVSGDNLEIQGIGKITLVIGENKWCLSDVLLVPTSTANLISISASSKDGIEFQFRDGTCKVFGKKGEICTAKLVKNLYMITSCNRSDESSCTMTSCVTNVVNFVGLSMATLHKRLGHASEKVIRRMVKGKMATGCNVQGDQFKFCEHCASGKMVSNPYKAVEEIRSKIPFFRAYMDLMGPYSRTKGLNRYAMVLTDDYSRFVHVFLLRRRNEAFSTYKNWHNRMSTQFNRKLAFLRCDGAKEFMSTEFTKYLNECGTTRETSFPYSPQQNGVAEAKIQKLQFKLRTLLSDSGLGKEFWGEAIKYLEYTTNRTYSAVTKTTPFQRWYGRKPDLSHLRPFGSQAFGLQKRSPDKISPRGVAGIMVGYSSEYSQRNTRISQCSIQRGRISYEKDQWHKYTRNNQKH